jgi:hypothetical protein
LLLRSSAQRGNVCKSIGELTSTIPLGVHMRIIIA